MSETEHGIARLTARVRGDVQGVGYRFFAQRQASALGLRGYVRN
ncbi:MAG: acylphosphatase, partial [Ktedonobacterales bacterium]